MKKKQSTRVRGEDQFRILVLTLLLEWKRNNRLTTRDLFEYLNSESVTMPR